MANFSHISEWPTSNRFPKTARRNTPRRSLDRVKAGVELWFVLLAVLVSMGVVAWSVVAPF